MSEGASEPEKEPVKHSFQRVLLAVFTFAFLTAETLIYTTMAFGESFWALIALYVLVPLVFSLVAARSSGKGKEYSKPVPALVPSIAFMIVSVRFWGLTMWYYSWWVVGGGGFLLGLAYLLVYDATLTLYGKAVLVKLTKRTLIRIILPIVVIVACFAVVGPYVPSAMEYLDAHQGATSVISAILAAVLGVAGGWLLGRKKSK